MWIVWEHYKNPVILWCWDTTQQVRTWAICIFLCFFCFLSVYIFSLFSKEKNVLKRTTVQRNWRWICLQGRPHPQSNPHLIPLSNSESSGRPIFHGATVGRSEAELLPSKQLPRFFPLLSTPQGKKKKYSFWKNMTNPSLLEDIKIAFHIGLTLYVCRSWKFTN